ncbi:carboxypeptidase-like regulatory domain-containing protein [Elusimicrobiota bacterium]
MFLISLVLLMTGCLPLPIPIRYGEEGTVADARTNAPIEGARVYMESWRLTPITGRKIERVDAYQTLTDTNGHFVIPVRRRWALVGFNPDMGPRYGSYICISKPGFNIFEVKPWEDNPGYPRIATMYELNPSPASGMEECSSEP